MRQLTVIFSIIPRIFEIYLTVTIPRNPTLHPPLWPYLTDRASLPTVHHSLSHPLLSASALCLHANLHPRPSVQGVEERRRGVNLYKQYRARHTRPGQAAATGTCRTMARSAHCLVSLMSLSSPLALYTHITPSAAPADQLSNDTPGPKLTLNCTLLRCK